MNPIARRARVLRLVALLTLAAAALPAAAQFAISQLPMASAPPPTNLVLTVDDSGSMQNAFVPDSVGNPAPSPPWPANTWAVAFTSSDYNRLYYNPNIKYDPPPDQTGKDVSTPTFGQAYLDGFNPAAGSLNLLNQYFPTLTYQPGVLSSAQATPAIPVGNAAYYFTYTGGPNCTLPIPWLPPPPDNCFTQTIVGLSGPVTATHPKAGWDETQNFANWYSFYRTRHLAIASSAAIAMSDAGLSSARVAWQGLTTCNDFTSGKCTGWQGPTVDNRLRTFADTATSLHRTDFFKWLASVPAANTTPTRLAWNRVGEYFRSKGKDSPYGVDPNNDSRSSAELACVNNFQITLTDGQWNTFEEGNNTNFCGTRGCGNEDTPKSAITLPDGQSYGPSANAKSSTSIYSDANAGGLADIAFYYWATNLRPDLTGSVGAVKPYYPDKSLVNPVTGSLNDPYWPYWNPRNDPATWPHMVNFTVGVGLTGALTLTGLNWYQDSFGGVPIGGSLNLASGSNGFSDLSAYAKACSDTTGNVPYPPACNWPTIGPNGAGWPTIGNPAPDGSNPGNVYDLWHAAVDSRGQAFSAESPDDLVSALKQIITRIEGQATGSSAAAGSSSVLVNGTTLYVATYAGIDWHGTLAAYAVAPSTAANAGAVSATATWSTDTTAGSIPPLAGRKVFTALVTTPLPGSGTTAVLGGTPFNSANSTLIASPLWGLLANSTVANDAANVVNYVLGDATDENPNGLKYRARPVSKLGDIVDSNPVYSSGESFGYQVLEVGATPEAAATVKYLDYVANVKKKRAAMVYVGANDGMLHGFDATANSATVGQEQFAYIPHSVVPFLPLLTNPAYAHRFYVDETPYVGDAFLNGSWRTVLVGTTGAGGKGVFALDVTQPQSFASANVLWDMDGTGAAGAVSNYGNADPDLGYTLGQPVVVRLNDGNWYATFGNGYLSTNACPVLYLVRLDNGNLVQKLYGEGNAATPCTGASGLGPNGLGSPTPLDMDGNGTTDFIYAGDLLGNLWKFDVHSTNNTLWGLYRFAGQSAPGLPLFTAKSAGTPAVAQSIVGAPNLGTGPNGVMLYFSTGHFFAAGDAADTSPQSVYAIQDSGSVIASRSTLLARPVTPAADGSGNLTVSQLPPINLMGVNDGWVVDLPASGERVMQQPFVVGNVVIFVSEIPSGDPCNGGFTSFLYGLNALSGAGGMNFFSSNGVFYDAIKSPVAGITGLTVVIESGTSILTYGFGPNFGGGSDGGGGKPPGGTTGGPTGNPTPAPPQPPCPPNVDCNRSPLTNATGRISWHEMVQ